MPLANNTLIMSVIGLLFGLAKVFVLLAGFIKSIVTALVATVVVLWLLREFDTSEVFAWIGMSPGS